MAGDTLRMEPGGPPPAVVTALRRLLRPLVRLLISHDITLPLLTELLKGVYVDVAQRAFRVEGKRQTDSRVSILTGVHRKDVKRLRSAASESYRPPAAASIGAKLVGRWMGTPRYLDENGRPKPLPRRSARGRADSFETLVESVSKDIRPRTVLDEWIRLGLVSLDEDGFVHLSEQAFIPKKDLDQLAYYFGRNLHDHMAAGVHNLLGEEPPFIERSVHYDRLSDGSVEELARLAEEAGMAALRRVNEAALDLAEKDRDDPFATRRMNLGIYFYRAESDEDPDPEREDG